MKTKILCAIALSSTLVASIAWAEGELSTSDYIRKSKSGICHTTSSPYYHKLKGYFTYSSMQDCLVSGGRKLGKDEKENASAATPLPPCDARQEPSE